MSPIDKIQQLCGERKITIAQLERDLGFGNGSLKKSKTLKTDRAEKIADYFGVDVNQLFSESESTDQKYSISNFEYQIILKYRSMSPSEKEIALKVFDLKLPDGERAADGSENIAV